MRLETLMTECLKISQKAGTTTLALCRVDRLNALNAELVEALISALNAAARDETTLVVIRGEGKGFCGGFDLSQLDSESEGDLALRFLRLETLLQQIYHAPFLTLALVHGACFGAGADMAASCSHRIATPDARFRMPGLKFGVVLGTRRLAQVVGIDNARRLLMAAEPFNAEEALRTNFINAVAEPDAWAEWEARCQDLSRALPCSSLKTMLGVTVMDGRDEDMAELARSISLPGLKKRIRNYVTQKERMRI
jgi:enoyl-CoA hydratase/carnithine racemase